MNDTCRSCGAPIRWVLTDKGRRMPLDPDPHPDGNIMPVTVTVGGAFPREETRAFVTTAPDGPAWRSHFATCPHAARHRKAAR